MYRFRFFLALLLTGLAAAFSPAQAQRCAWGQTLPNASPTDNLSPSIATDGAGNTYVFGTFKGQLSVGGITVTSHSPTDPDVYVASYRPTGQLRWLKSGGSPPPPDPTSTIGDWPFAITADPTGRVFLGGFTQKNFSFGALHVDSACYYMMRLDGATGNLVWFHKMQSHKRRPIAFSPDSGGFFQPRYLQADAAGNCYVAGNFHNLDSLHNIPTPGGRYGANDALVAKCDANGRFLWATQLFGPYVGLLYFSGLGVDAQGRVTVGGSFGGGSCAFGSLTSPLTITCHDSLWYDSDCFVARFDANGTPRWVKHGASPPVSTAGGRSGSMEEVRALAVDAAGNTYIAGRADTAGLSWNGVPVPITRTSRYAFFMMKFDPAGTLLWARNDNSGEGGNGPFALTLDAAGRPYQTGFLNVSGSIGPFALAGPQIGSRSGLWLAGYDTAGNVRWARTSSTTSPESITGRGVSVDASGHIYVLARSAYASIPNDVAFDGVVTRGRGCFVLRFDEAAQLTGRAYLDQNANSVRDAGEGPFPRPVFVSETARPYAATTSPITGRFTVFADTGAYQISIPQAPPHYRVTEGAAGYTGHLRAYGQTDTARVFGLAPVANQPDVRLTMTAFGGARRGFVNRYRVRVENIGTTTVAGQLTVTLDSLLAYTGATPAPAQHTGQVVRWNFTGLPPFGIRDYDLAVTVPLNVALGTIVRSHAIVAVPNDLAPTNDVDTTRQTVVASHDPNELTVNYSTLTPAQIATGTELDYIVHFQNLGTDTAFTVVITDTLPARLLQLGTLYVVSQSHNCRVDLLGNNQLVMRFDNINLPPNSVSVLESGGFIRFRVKPRAALTPGALIPNQAHIVFDYNAPLATNQVTTLVQRPNGLAAEPDAAKLSLYPNPADQATRVTLTAEVPVSGPATVALTDVLGRLVRQETMTAPAGEWHYAVATPDLKPGVYVVRLTLPGGSTVNRKLVVR